ncbi:MAG: phage portal protein [Mogibacterium sp.]|nr:phage portal protein [Mogibacterium sp.]
MTRRGLFDWLFPKQPTQTQREGSTTFRLTTAYEPVFHDYFGSLYEDALVRSAIEAKARHISKLKVEMQGSAQPSLKSILKKAPNDWMTWPQFLARCSTILDCTNNLFIVPVQDKYLQTIGFFPVLPERVKLLEDKKGKLWVQYQFKSDQFGYVEFDRCAYLNKHQYRSDMYGENNTALNSTMNLIAINDQAIKEAVRSSASYRFMARVTNFTAPDDLALERQRFTRDNLSGDSSGLLLFPNTYADIKQIDSKAYTVDAEQMKLIQTNVFNYFGVNEDIIQSKAKSDALDAFFNSVIEPFAISLSEAMSRAIYTDREREFGNHVYVSANRLQYMTTSEKVSMAQQLGDRGVLTVNEIRELFNYAPIEGGDVAYIRGEYKPTEAITEGGAESTNEESGSGRS